MDVDEQGDSAPLSQVEEREDAKKQELDATSGANQSAPVATISEQGLSNPYLDTALLLFDNNGPLQQQQQAEVSLPLSPEEPQTLSGLVMDDQKWADLLLGTRSTIPLKSWEIRSTNCTKRECIYICIKDHVQGDVFLYDVVPSANERKDWSKKKAMKMLRNPDNFKYHRVEDLSRFDEYQNIFIWKFRQPHRYVNQIKVTKKKGARGWARLPVSILSKIEVVDSRGTSSTSSMMDNLSLSGNKSKRRKTEK